MGIVFGGATAWAMMHAFYDKGSKRDGLSGSAAPILASKMQAPTAWSRPRRNAEAMTGIAALGMHEQTDQCGRS
jgi:hypothetical protein